MRSNTESDKRETWRMHDYSIRTTNYLQGGHFESEYLDQFHISIHTLSNLLQAISAS